jgi:hypothetical protein
MIAFVMNPGQRLENTGVREMGSNEKFFNTRSASFLVRMRRVDPVKILEYAALFATRRCNALTVAFRDVPDSGLGLIVHSQR